MTWQFRRWKCAQCKMSRYVCGIFKNSKIDKTRITLHPVLFIVCMQSTMSIDQAEQPASFQCKIHCLPQVCIQETQMFLVCAYCAIRILFMTRACLFLPCSINERTMFYKCSISFERTQSYHIYEWRQWTRRQDTTAHSCHGRGFEIQKVN